MLQKAYMVPHPPLIVPAVGRGEERMIQDTTESYRKIAKEIAALKPDTIILSTPHSILYRDYFHISPGSGAHGDLAQFRAPQVQADVLYDEALVQEIENQAAAAGIPAGTLGEQDKSLDHASMVPLYFLNEADPELLKHTKLIRVGLSGLPLDTHKALGKIIAQAADTLDRNIVYIASGDCSHVLKNDGPYGYRPEGPAFDKALEEIVEDGNLDKMLDFNEEFCDQAAECGLRSFVMMDGALTDIPYKAELLSYEGPFGVGYLCAEVEPEMRGTN